MESSGIFPGGLDLPRNQNHRNPQELHPHPMASYLPQEPLQPPPGAVKYPFPAKAQQSNASEDDEQGFAADGEGKGKKVSPWQRMKWTDTMVRLLITAVFYIGDEGGSEAGSEQQSGKKKAGGVLQKKGKWKSVSKAMMEKGFYVSPQQCEDKFNDLNKRYKRVNDILGKGTACKVVENQTLLESTDLTPKLKEEARKLLNSKHLFFREMCAYHNTCRHSSNNNHHQTAIEPSHIPQQQRCSEEESEEEEEESESEDSEEDEAESEETESRKRRRRGAVEELRGEVRGVVEDGGRSAWEKRQWMKRRLIELEELQVKYESEGLEMEKQRLKWVKFRSNKEREMERGKLENDKRRLENERMLLIVKKKDLEFMMEIHHYQHHSSTKRGDPSSITG